MAGKPKDQRDSEIIKEAVKKANEDISANKHNIDAAISDLKMLVGDVAEHWTSNGINFADKRKEAGLPSMVFNRLGSLADQQEGDLRSNPPSCKLRPMGDGATQKLADFREGRIRAILAESLADRAFKEAGKSFIQCGFANWRVVTEYANDRTRNQIIRVKPIANPFAVIWDRMSQDYFKLDADHVMLLDKIHKDKYTKTYKGKIPASVSVQYGGENWYHGDVYTIAEYFRKEDNGSKTVYFLPMDDNLPEQLLNIWLPIKLAGMSNDQYVEEIPEQLKEPWDELLKLGKVHERKVKKTKIYRYLISGHEILEAKQEWLSEKYFPIVHVHGRKTNIDGKVYIESVTRPCGDSQRIYNVGRNASAENLAMAPKAPYLAAFEAIEGFQSMWDTALTKPFSSLYWNAFTKDGKPLPKPERTQPAQASTAITETTMMAIDEMRSMANVFDPTMAQGMQGDVSGVAIQRRVSRSEMGNYEFRDNFADSIKLTWLIINDILSKVEDTERQVTIRDIEGKSKDEWINKPNPNYGTKPGEPQYINDMSQGIYEITATTGPSYATQRMEAATFMTELAAKLPPPYNTVMADFAIKYQDYHGAAEATERFRMMMINGGLGYLFKPEELMPLLQRIAQSEMIIKQVKPPQPNPLMISKMKDLMASAVLKIAKAEEARAKAKLTQAEYAEKEMMIIGATLNQLMQMSMQPQQPPQGQIAGPGQGQLPQGPNRVGMVPV